jgi:CRP-like cAMP-binding protein
MKQDSFAADSGLFQALAKRSMERPLGDSCTLFSEGEFPKGLHIIRDGEASLMMFSPSERIIACFRAGPGSVLGLPAVVGLVPYTLSAIVRKGSIVGFIELEAFNDLLREQPSLYPSVLSLLASEVRASRSALVGVKESPSSHQAIAERTFIIEPPLARV